MNQELDEKTKAINALVDLCRKKGWKKEVLLVAEKGASQEAIDDLIMAFAIAGDVDHAIEAAKLINRELTRKEIDELVNSCSIKGKLQDGLKAAKMGASKEGLKPLLEAAIARVDIGIILEVVELRDGEFNGKNIVEITEKLKGRWT